jgi:hypothetical protein
VHIISKLLLSCFLLVACALASPLRADSEKRIALVIGNAAYQAGVLATPANDAGLIAQTLQAAGFDVTGARDLDGESLRSAFHDFLDKAQASGPDKVAFVYLAGYGVQLDNENYFVPVDAKITSASDVAAEALRISDYTKRLAGLPLKASFIVLDAARVSPFAKSGQPLAGGLALAEAAPNMLMAFNAAPGTVAPDESGPYGAYAQALTEMIREGGLSPSQVFDGVRLRVSEAMKGAQVPWTASRISAPFVFFERASDRRHYGPRRYYGGYYRRGHGGYYRRHYGPRRYYGGYYRRGYGGYYRRHYGPRRYYGGYYRRGYGYPGYGYPGYGGYYRRGYGYPGYGYPGYGYGYPGYGGGWGW